MAVPAAAAPVAPQSLLTPPEQPKPAETPAAAPVTAKLPLKISFVHGLRPADLVGNKSDVYVEVSLEGKADSKVTTAVVSAKAAQRVGAEPGEKDSVEVELNFSGELPNYVEGDKIIITVKDKDLVGSDALGKAVVTDGKFGGRIELEDAGDGYKAFIMVQLGDGKDMEHAVAEFKKTWDETQKKLVAAAALAASGEAAKVAEAAKAAAAAVQEAAAAGQEVAVEALEEVKGSVYCFC